MECDIAREGSRIIDSPDCLLLFTVLTVVITFLEWTTEALTYISCVPFYIQSDWVNEKSTEIRCLHKQIADDDGISVVRNRWRGKARRRELAGVCVCKKREKERERMHMCVHMSPFVCLIVFKSCQAACLGIQTE